MAQKDKKQVEEVEDAAQEQEPEKPKKGKLFSLLIIFGIVLAVSVGGYFAYSMYIGPKFLQKGKDSAKNAPKEAEKHDKLGIVISLKPFVVNLIDEKGARYLKMTMELEIDSEEEEAKAEVEKHVPQFRDSVIMLLTSKRYEDIMTLEGKIKMRDEILARTNRFLKDHKIRNVYFSEFVVQ